METILGDLLEEMDKLYPENITIKELKKRGFSQKIIIESLHKGFIDYPYEMRDYPIEEAEIKDTMFVILSSNGFLALNQIRIKKATDELNKSIVNFDKSSDKSSKNMIDLTVWIKWLSIGLLFISIVQIGLLLKQLNWI